AAKHNLDKTMNLEYLCNDTFLAAHNNYCIGRYESSFNFFNHIVNKYPNTSRIPDAKFYLALHYKDGNYVEKNDIKASDLFEQVAQSNSKYKDNANYHLAMYYAEKNGNKAFFLFNQVSQSDSEYKYDAKYILAKFYETGRGGARKNYKKAFDIYFELSKSNSHLHADAKNCLA
ncbi:1987_t:CDS:1, partial [Dentiscutata heterogama]